MTRTAHAASGTAAKVSVACCTYNGGRHIREQLQSILNQSRVVDEIVVSDDGSSDNTLEQVTTLITPASYAGTKISLIDGPRHGITKNFSHAITACTGDIIFLSDQDDIWAPNKVERITSEFEGNSNLLVFSNASLVDDSLNELKQTQFDFARVNPEHLAYLGQEAFFAKLLKRNFITGATVAFRRELLEKALPFATSWLHDEWLGIIAAAYAKPRIVPDCLIQYRQHNNNACGMKQTSVLNKLTVTSGTTLTVPEQKRLEQLLERLENTVGYVSPLITSAVRKALHFHATRNHLTDRRLLRIPQVMANYISGGYSNFADGWRTAVKDVLRK